MIAYWTHWLMTVIFCFMLHILVIKIRMNRIENWNIFKIIIIWCGHSSTCIAFFYFFLLGKKFTLQILCYISLLEMNFQSLTVGFHEDFEGFLSKLIYREALSLLPACKPLGFTHFVSKKWKINKYKDNWSTKYIKKLNYTSWFNLS